MHELIVVHVKRLPVGEAFEVKGLMSLLELSVIRTLLPCDGSLPQLFR